MTELNLMGQWGSEAMGQYKRLSLLIQPRLCRRWQAGQATVLPHRPIAS